MDAPADSSTDGMVQPLVHKPRLRQADSEAETETLYEARHVSERASGRDAELYDFGPVAYVTLDRTGVIIRANQAALTMLGATPARIGVRRLGAFIADESLPAFAVFLGRILSKRKTQSCEVTLRPVAEQTIMDENVVILMGRSAVSRQECIVAIINITERKRREIALQQAKDEAERANLAKSRFLAAASYDLRQPLQTLYLINGIMGRRGGDTPPGDLIASQDLALEVMSGMLNGLLDVNQIQAGFATPEPIAFCLAPMLDRLARDFAVQAGTLGTTWRVVSSRLTVRSDPRLLEPILRTLLLSAFRYTYRGKVVLGCRRHGAQVCIDVCDNGVGIAPDPFDATFREFVQIEPRHCRELGLGLAIVQSQAALLNHPLRVRSNPGRGSVFSIELPLVEPGSPDLTAVSPALVVPQATIRERKILLVEDDETIGAMLKTLFVSEGAVVVTSPDEGKLSALIEQMPGGPDLIVTDYTLSNGLTGLDAIATVRAETSADLPAILLTGDLSAEALHQVARLPGCLHLTKPVTIHELLRAVGLLLSRPRSVSVAAEGETVFVIDDDGPLCEAIASLLREEGLTVETYSHAEAFLKTFDPNRNGCLLIDAVMPGIGGIELLRQLRSRNSRLPAIMMTGHGDVAMAVAAMKAGAIDFVAKPVHPLGLLATVRRALEKERDLVVETRRRKEAAELISSLTPREYDVLEQLLAGHRNKVIAHYLGISQRTVENHRAAVMRKTKSKALFDLLRTVIAAQP